MKIFGHTGLRDSGLNIFILWTKQDNSGRRLRACENTDGDLLTRNWNKDNEIKADKLNNNNNNNK